MLQALPPLNDVPTIAPVSTTLWPITGGETEPHGTSQRGGRRAVPGKPAGPRAGLGARRRR